MDMWLGRTCQPCDKVVCARTPSWSLDPIDSIIDNRRAHFIVLRDISLAILILFVTLSVSSKPFEFDK